MGLLQEQVPQLPCSPTAQFPEARVAEHGASSHFPAWGKQECCGMLCLQTNGLREFAAHVLCSSVWFSRAQINEIFQAIYRKYISLNLPHFILYNYPASMVATFVSSALVLKGFLTQENCVLVGEEKNPLSKKTLNPREDSAMACLFI